MMITPEYQALNRALHETNPNYGTTAPRYVRQVYDLIVMMGAKTVIDYGCGKGLFKQGIDEIRKGMPPIQIQEYDPAIPGKDARPWGAELLVSIDVLEHIEPDSMEDVLHDMYVLSDKAAFLTVATRPAAKTLADGRNAHLIVQPVDWWLPRLLQFFSPRLLHVGEGEFVFFGLPQPKAHA